MSHVDRGAQVGVCACLFGRCGQLLPVLAKGHDGDRRVVCADGLRGDELMTSSSVLGMHVRGAAFFKDHQVVLVRGRQHEHLIARGQESQA